MDLSIPVDSAPVELGNINDIGTMISFEGGDTNIAFTYLEVEKIRLVMLKNDNTSALPSGVSSILVGEGIVHRICKVTYNSEDFVFVIYTNLFKTKIISKRYDTNGKKYNI